MVLHCSHVSLREQARSHGGMHFNVGASLLEKGPEMAPDNQPVFDTSSRRQPKLSRIRFTANFPSMICCSAAMARHNCQ
jgi:hypothetical protein